MKIYSKFHDYYDTALGFGIDPACHYVRKTVKHDKNQQEIFKLNEVELFFNRAPPGGSYRANYRFTDGQGIEDVSPELILVAGKIHPVLVIKTINKNGVTKKHYIYSVEDMDNLVKRYFTKKKAATYHSKKHEKFSGSWKYDRYRLSNRKHMVSFFNQFEGATEDRYHDAHFAADVPVLLLKEDQIIYNPILRVYKFFRILPPYQAFQEISMFVSGIMGGKSPKMVEISDEIRLQKHGFDKKTSFRKDKEDAA